jgi:hypothetical protein
VTTRRRKVAAAVGASALLAGVPTAAHAQSPSEQLVKQYQQAYAKAKRQGADPGRNILRHDVLRKDGSHREARRGEVRRSLGVLERMVAPAAASGSGSTASATLQAIAQCESGGDPTAVDASGTYRGKYQFDMGTWASVGGTGDPAAAPEAEQDMRAQMLLDRSGTSPWPVCG